MYSIHEKDNKQHSVGPLMNEYRGKHSSQLRPLRGTIMIGTI